MPLKRTLKDLAAEVRQEGDVREVDPAELREMRESQPETIIIDVRELEERRQSGRLPGAVGIARGVLERDIAKRVFDGEVSDQQLQRPIVCYCGGGARSLLAAQQLHKLGFERVFSLKGGFGAWRAAELPTEDEEKKPA